MIGHITYLCEESMHNKFGRRFQDKDTPNFDFNIDMGQHGNIGGLDGKIDQFTAGGLETISGEAL